MQQRSVSLIKTFLWEFWLFGIKQASASIFGGYLLALIIITKYWYPITSIYRYDFLLIAAVGFQLFLLLFRFETLKEAVVIILFHIVATAMEVFKTSAAIGAWYYPGEFTLGIGNVPLFAGFMYSAVGSYIVRVNRIFDIKFSCYPPLWLTWIYVFFVYLNFYTYHYFWDLREVLLLGSLLLYGGSIFFFRIDRVYRWMPCNLGGFLVALFIWFAENIGTYTHVWIYPTQSNGWEMVPISKLIAWYLLVLLSFVLYTLVNPPEIMVQKQIGSESPTEASRQMDVLEKQLS